MPSLGPSALISRDDSFSITGKKSWVEFWFYNFWNIKTLSKNSDCTKQHWVALLHTSVRQRHIWQTSPIGRSSARSIVRAQSQSSSFNQSGCLRFQAFRTYFDQSFERSISSVRAFERSSGQSERFRANPIPSRARAGLIQTAELKPNVWDLVPPPKILQKQYKII